MAEIDPVQYGKLIAQVEQLESEVSALRSDVKTLLELANQSKGGLWVGMSIASALGGVVTFVGERMLK